jgi:type VI secretion system protein ImpE
MRAAGGANMDAKELLDAGRLAAAIEQLNQQVRAHPADAKLRTFLFEVLCFAGDYERAQRQLDVLGQLNEQAESGTIVYRSVLAAERARVAVVTEDQLPVFLLEPPAFASLYLAALHRLREGNASDARALLLEAMEAQPATPGKIDGQPFADFADADPFLGPFLEVIINGRYIWIPFVQIKRFAIEPPRRLRDLLWAEATLETIDGPSGNILLPVLYTGSFRHPDEQIRLGRATEWEDVGENLVRGRGQRMFLVDDDEKPMLQCRQIEFDAAS